LGCAASACTVTADWYFPAGSSPQGLIYLQHGFLANAAMYSYTAAALAEDTDSIVVAPTLTSNFFAINALWLGGAPMAQAVANLFVGDRTALTTSASAADGHPVTLPTRLVLVGHSLGGTLVLGVAGDMADNGSIDDLAGVVLFDGVALQPTLVSTTVAKVPSNLPILMIASPPYWLNVFGQTVNALVNARPGQFDGVQLVGGRHIDYMQGGNPLIQLGAYLVGGFSRPRNIDVVKTLASGWINDMFEGTHNGIYAMPGQTIQIPTAARTATAIALPAPTTPLTPLYALLSSLLEFLFGAIANFEPTSGFALV
ncbi:MAG TPA: alpha/beta hydrolase, partial [Mycobacterium sp.]|nr:alpha/beta hydrolase [Mycobacterium sp.]